MEPVYQDGEVALIRECSFDYDGAVYAVAWNEQLYIKKVYLEKDGYRLVSINKDFPDKFAPVEDEPRIVGKIVGNFMPIEQSKPPVELVVCSAAISRLFRPGPKAH